jgi:hypothetical protein
MPEFGTVQTQNCKCRCHSSSNACHVDHLRGLDNSMTRRTECRSAIQLDLRFVCAFKSWNLRQTRKRRKQCIKANIWVEDEPDMGARDNLCTVGHNNFFSALLNAETSCDLHNSRIGNQDQQGTQMPQGDTALGTCP